MKICSTISKGRIIANAFHGFHPHTRQMTKNAMMEVMSMVAVTAIP